MKNISTALVRAQAKMKKVAKNAYNPHFKSKYASLDDIIDMIRPILDEHDLGVIHMPVTNSDGVGVKSILVHASGEAMDLGEFYLPLGRGGGAQGAGSSITYAKRYALAAIFNLATGEDDDGNAAQKAKPNPEMDAIRGALKDNASKYGQEASMKILRSLGVEKATDLPSGSLDKVLSLIEDQKEIV